MSNQKSKKKTGLNVTSVSKDHWSSRGGMPKVEGTRLVVTILNGKGLLASDVLTGKSDPICFLWCGLPIVSSAPKSTVDEFMEVTDEDECAKIGILRTKVCPTTLEPVWNEDIVFPLAVDDTYSLAQLRCLIYVRDEDIDDDEMLSYDELGMCEISVKDILMYGKPLRTSIAYISKQLDLKSSPKMKKSAEGYIKVTCTLIFDETDTQKMYPEIGDGIKSLDVFLQKLQQILRGNFCFSSIPAEYSSILNQLHLPMTDRSERENGLQTYWGRSSSPVSGFRRTIGSDTGSGEATGRTTYRGRSARGRSQSPSLQVAPTVRSSCSAIPQNVDDGPTDGTVSSRPAIVPKLDYRKKILVDDKSSLEDVKEGDEGTDCELHIVPSIPLAARKSGAKITSLESIIPVDLKQNSVPINAALDREHGVHPRVASQCASEISGRTSSISSVSHFDRPEPLSGRDSLEGEVEGGVAEAKECGRNTFSTKAQGKDTAPRIVSPSYSSLSGAEVQVQVPSPVQVQGNAAVAARALREVASNKDSKQLSLDYISS